MTSLTERYLAATLRGIPERQRADVERELRSSIADALEDRIEAGESRTDAERSVLEGLGDPTRLAAGITGRPLYLIGPDLLIQYRHLLLTLLTIVVPIVAVVMAAVEVGGGGDIGGAIVQALGGGLTVAVHLAFWVTLTFVFVERVDAARDARKELQELSGRWTVDSLPVVQRTGSARVKWSVRL